VLTQIIADSRADAELKLHLQAVFTSRVWIQYSAGTALSEAGGEVLLETTLLRQLSSVPLMVRALHNPPRSRHIITTSGGSSMKHQIVFATAFSAALAVGAAAQTGTGTATGAQTGQQDRPQPVTLTGCVQSGSASSAGTAASGTTGAGATGSSSSAAHYILTNAASASSTAAGSTGTSGTASGAAGSPIASSYRLMGRQDDLKKFLNAKVEVRGSIDKRGATSGPASGTAASGTGTGTGAPPTGTSASASDQNLPIFRVTSVRKIADTCSGN
jgi:hypothetical protein